MESKKTGNFHSVARKIPSVRISGMARWFVLVCGWAALSRLAFGAEELPVSDPDASFEVEPPLLIPYRLPGNSGELSAAEPATMEVDIERLSKEVERAKRSALSAERLFRIGVLAKVEAEQRALKAVRLQSDLENARLARIKADAAAQNGSKTEAAATPSTVGDAELARAIEVAHAAAKKREEAELAAAEVNLARQQKLLFLGSGRKADVVKAERKLAELKAAKD
jgi:hypothetical protein